MPWICLSYLVLQACISFCSVSDKRGGSLFLPCSHKNAVAHVVAHYMGVSQLHVALQWAKSLILETRGGFSASKQKQRLWRVPVTPGRSTLMGS